MEVNPQLWYGERKLSFTRPHFIKASSPATSESLFWVETKLTGRYSIQVHAQTLDTWSGQHTYLYFENPADATMYELRWSGTK